MNVESATQLIDAITKLIAVVVWPALVLFVLVRFAPSLQDFFASLGEISLKGVGFEATAKRRQAEAAAALVAASVSRPHATSTPQAAAQSAKEAAAVVTRSVTARVIRRASDARALWVDDDPDRNVFERQSLEALGLSFVLAASTEEALDRVAHQHFDVVISDLERPSDSRRPATRCSTGCTPPASRRR